MAATLYTFPQKDRYKSPRPLRELILQLAWEWTWFTLCIWTPKPLNRWRLFWLRVFGCKLHGTPIVFPRARIEVPWNLTMHDRSLLGDRAHAYSLGPIELQARCIVAQEVYLCSGTHDFNDRNLPLQTAKITIGSDAFIGARSFVMPGVTIGQGAVVGACSVVTHDVPVWSIAAGNPCRTIGKRSPIEP